MANTRTQHYGGYATRKGTKIIAHFDADDVEIGNAFDFFNHALEDAYASKKRGTVDDEILENIFKSHYGREKTPRDEVEFALIGAVSMFLMAGLNDPYGSDSETLVCRTRAFIDELAGSTEDMIQMPRGSLSLREIYDSD